MAAQPPKRVHCSCAAAGLSCSVFCACRGSENCRNTHTITAVRAEDYIDVDQDDNDKLNN